MMRLLQTLVLLALLTEGSAGRARTARQPCPSRRCRCRRLAGGVLHLRCGKPLDGTFPAFAPSNLTFSLVTLSYRNLTSIPEGAFSNLRIQRLDLRGNNLTRGLPADAFQTLHGALEVLQLSNCGLNEIPATSVSKLHLLKVLNMADNGVHVLRSGAFQGNANLLELSLYRNRIRTIESGAFRGLDALQQLRLFSNRLQSVSRKSLRGLRNLTSLDLSRNAISTLRAGAFRDLKRLTWLELESNLLNLLNFKTFKGLTNLKYLNLAGNPLTRLGEGTFLAIRRLKYLSLDLGDISVLNDKTFKGLARLKSFFIGEVNRTTLASGIFGEMRKLKSLSVWDYSRLFGGLTPDYFSAEIDYRQLSIWTMPVHECTCKTDWIRRMTRKCGAYVHGYCANSQPISCKRRIKKKTAENRVNGKRIRKKTGIR